MNESIDIKKMKEDIMPPASPQQEIKPEEEQSKKKDTILIVSILIIILLLGAIFFIPKFMNPPLTLEQLHQRNIEGKLPPDKGYIYGGKYSFIYLDNLWYTLLFNEGGSRAFSIPVHYGPREVEDITPVGVLNYSILDAYPEFFITFDPKDEGLQYIGVSIGESARAFMEAFGKKLTQGCIHNNSAACINRQVITCNSTNAPVFYFASEPETRVLYLNNCVIITGSGEELFRATDRMLFDVMGIMKQ